MAAKKHVLKAWPQFFGPVWDGRKRAELRRNDRGFNVGDFLLLREFDPTVDGYSGREINATITHMVHGPAFGLEAGHSVLSIEVNGRTVPWTPDADT